MEQIYWIITIGKIATFCSVLTVLSVIAIFIVFITWLNAEEVKHLKTASIITSILLSFGIFGTIFIPSTKEMLAIYGVGTTIDYVLSSDECSQLPDNVIRACNKFLIDYTSKDKKEE